MNTPDVHPINIPLLEFDGNQVVPSIHPRAWHAVLTTRTAIPGSLERQVRTTVRHQSLRSRHFPVPFKILHGGISDAECVVFGGVGAASSTCIFLTSPRCSETLSSGGMGPLVGLRL